MFVSFGTGFYQLPLLNALKNLNIPIIGIDQNPNSVGKNLCDIFFQCSLLEKSKIINFLKPYKKNLIGIYSRSFGKVLETANEIAHYFELPSNPVETMKKFQNKKEILEIALEHSFLQDQKEQIQNIEKSKFWIVKPLYSSGKRNIQIIKNFKNFTNKDQFIIEPFYEGKEYIFFGFVISKKLYPLVITQKEIVDFEKVHLNYEYSNLLFCDKKHFFPSDLNEMQKYKIFQISNFIIKKTNLILGPFLAEFIVNGDHIFFIEAVPEVGGEFIADYLIPDILQIPYFEYLINLYSNQNLESIKENLNLLLEKEKEKKFIINYILQKEGKFLNLEFPKDLWKSEYYYFHHILKEKGICTTFQKKNLDRLAVFGLSGTESLSKLIQLAQQIEKNTIIKYE